MTKSIESKLFWLLGTEFDVMTTNPTFFVAFVTSKKKLIYKRMVATVMATYLFIFYLVYLKQLDKQFFS